MKITTFVPASPGVAGAQLHLASLEPLHHLARGEFVRAWSSIAYLFPGLHPDGFDAPDSGWPRSLMPFAAEAWRRSDGGLLTDEELYPADSQWAGIYDRMDDHTPEEAARRSALRRHS